MNKCKLEIKTIVFNYLNIIADAYESGNFENVFEYLADDCVFESQWVMVPNTGIEEVKDYLISKGETLKRTGYFPDCDIVELLGNHKIVENVDLIVNEENKHGSFSLMYEPGELCLLMKQTIDEKESKTILRLTLNQEYKVSRIDLCMPTLFKYEYFSSNMVIEPSKDGIENNDALIRISKCNCTEFYMFFETVGLFFSEYDDEIIEIDKWIEFLECWRKFTEFQTFDEAFEDILGLDYSNWSSVDEELLKTVSSESYDVWKNSKEYGLVYELIEWTEKYKDSCDHISVTML